jgi:flagellin
MLIDNTADFTTLGTVIDTIDTALDSVNNARAVYGATQSRFEAVISNLQVAVENQTAARSRIMDADFAQETSNMSRAQILQQAGNAMVAQANQLPQQVLSLLQR